MLLQLHLYVVDRQGYHCCQNRGKKGSQVVVDVVGEMELDHMVGNDVFTRQLTQVYYDDSPNSNVEASPERKKPFVLDYAAKGLHSAVVVVEVVGERGLPADDGHVEGVPHTGSKSTAQHGQDNLFKRGGLPLHESLVVDN